MNSTDLLQAVINAVATGIERGQWLSATEKEAIQWSYRKGQKKPEQIAAVKAYVAAQYADAGLDSKGRKVGA